MPLRPVLQTIRLLPVAIMTKRHVQSGRKREKAFAGLTLIRGTLRRSTLIPV